MNDWLVKEEVARYAEPMKTCDFLLYYSECDICEKIAVELPKPIETSDIESVVRSFDAENTVGLSDIEDDDIEKEPARALRNVPSSNEKLLRMLRNHRNSQDNDSKCSKSLLENEKLEKPMRSISLLEKLSALNVMCSSLSDSSVCTSQVNKNFACDAQQIDSYRPTDPEHLRNNNEKKSRNSEFELRDSDDEFNVQNNFGTFQSMYGGRGLMRPCDWSEADEDISCKKGTQRSCHT